MTRALRALRALAPLAVLASVALASVAVAQDPRASVVAGVARSWLAIVDRGDAAAARVAAGEKFRTAMTDEVWARALAKERGDRGPLIQRSAASTSFDPPLPGAPPGEYAMVLFRTAFERQPNASETIVLERERDGTWRVVGYTIR